MKFEEDKKIEDIGKMTGYLTGYFLFTTMLFFVLMLTEKMPVGWNYLYMMGITLLIMLTGEGLKRILK